MACASDITVDGCTAPGGSTVARTVHVEDANGDPLTVTWRVDGTVVQIDNVPAGGPPTSQRQLTHFYPLECTRSTWPWTTAPGTVTQRW